MADARRINYRIRPQRHTTRLENHTRPITQLWYRLACIDDAYWEYNQPFFAANPQEWVTQFASETARKGDD